MLYTFQNLSIYITSSLSHTSASHKLSLQIYPSWQPKSVPLFPQLLKLIPQATVKIHLTTLQAHLIYTFMVGIDFWGDISLTGRQESQSSGSYPQGAGAIWVCPKSPQEGRQGKALSWSGWTWLSCRITGHIYKADNFCMESNISICISSECISCPLPFLP